MEHAFNTNVAKEYDVDIAIILNNFKFWTISNLANNRHIHDGLCWTFNSIPALCTIFPYWTRHQIEHLLNKCKKLGLLVSGNYNSHKYDRTRWYALTGIAYQLYPELQQEDFITSLWETISEKTEMQLLHPAISENSEKLFEKFRGTFLKNPRPIPDIKTDINTDTIDQASDEAEEDVKIPTQKPTKSKSSQFDLQELLADNPHEIPEPMLKDWLDVRKSKKNKVTPTAWIRINRILIEVHKEVGITPREAFETMVANAWQSLEVKYFIKDNGIAKKTADDFPAYI
jgi:hypothetical protein